MIAQKWTAHAGTAAIAFGLLGFAVYLLMIGITLAHIEAVSGLRPFDMRPMGYAARDAANLLNALGDDGRRYYLSRQIVLDTAYPALMAMTLVSLFLWLGRPLGRSKFMSFGIALAVAAALFDYSENFGIAAMILTWPNFSETLVVWTSTATVAKSVLTTLAVLMLLVIGVFGAYRSKRGLG